MSDNPFGKLVKIKHLSVFGYINSRRVNFETESITHDVNCTARRHLITAEMLAGDLSNNWYQEWCAEHERHIIVVKDLTRDDLEIVSLN